MHYKNVEPTVHYLEFHEHEVPWYEVQDIIIKSKKNMRKNGSNYEIDTERYYILCRLEGDTLWVINAKTK